jgi:N-methylhydantoinase A
MADAHSRHRQARNVRLGIDVGGTFTDLALFDLDSGETIVTKAPTTPANPIEGVRAVIEKADVSPDAVRELVHGTTVATNALLERKKATPALLTTDGFADIVFIQRGNRRHHYDLTWRKPRPYVERTDCFEIRERLDAKGQVVTELDEEQVRSVARRLRDRGVGDVAISFLFSFVDPLHELRARELVLDEHPDAHVSLSHEVYPRWREFDRTSTTLADAFLKSLVTEYVTNLADGLNEQGIGSAFTIMKSNGGIQDYRAAAAKPIDLVVSGPVGGVLSAVFLGKLMERPNLISVDMGGTSFDVSLIEDGRPGRTMEHEIEWGLPVYTPMVDVRTIGAGGGSLAWIDKGGLLRVGPASAGAVPGPACYGRGGTQPTVTDANAHLGRLNPDYFLGGQMSLDIEAADRALGAVATELGLDLDSVAMGIVDLVDANMVNAVRLVSIDRGLDPREFTLFSFGGAGSLHAAALAELAGVSEVAIPLHQGVLSAFGLMTADVRVDESVTANLRSDSADPDRISEIFVTLAERATRRLRTEGYVGEAILEVSIEMRYMGQNYETEIAVPFEPEGMGRAELDAILERFHAEHARLYGYDIPDELIELVHFNVTAVGVTEQPTIPRWEIDHALEPKAERRVYFGGEGWTPTPVYDRLRVPAGASIEGPAVIEEEMATTLVHPGQDVRCDPYGNLLLRTSHAHTEAPSGLAGSAVEA